jgi:glucosamine-6-phosphate deaminase
MILSTKVDKMTVTVFETNVALGKAAAEDFARIVKQEVAAHGKTSVILATGNSQLSFVNALRDQTDIPWDKVSVFHMDEYLGISPTHSASFRLFLQEKIDALFHPQVTHLIMGDAPDTQAELQRYTDLLQQNPPSVCVLGIGENGHLAFNDPPADFLTRKLIHVVTLDTTCRQQQVNEGHFPTIDDVPKQALSLTVPALLSASHVMALVPEARKAVAVQAALEGPVTENCPASILRTQEHVQVYLDQESAALLQWDAKSQPQ